MRLILIRHAESKANAKQIPQGQKINTSLSKKGKNQAKQVAQRLKNEDIDIIYASDLKRAKKTARHINKFHGLKIIYDKRIREIDLLEGKKKFFKRISSFFQEIKNLDKNILIVAHGGTNRVLLAIASGENYEEKKKFRRNRQSNTAVNIIEKQGEHFKINLSNSINHLDSDKELIKIFEKVQKIPYKVIKYEESEIDENLKFGDCRHKTYLLKKMLDKKGYRTKRMKVIFDWKDLPLPKRVLNKLKKSSSIWVHNMIAVKVHGDYLFVDATWNPELEKLGFPITKKWSSLEDTKQVTEGNLEYYRKYVFEENEKQILKEHKIKINKKEAHEFAEALNDYLGVRDL